MLFLAPKQHKVAKPVGERPDWERWRQKQTRPRVAQPFKVGWLHLTGQMCPRDSGQRRGGLGLLSKCCSSGQLLDP